MASVESGPSIGQIFQAKTFEGSEIAISEEQRIIGELHVARNEAQSFGVLTRREKVMGASVYLLGVVVAGIGFAGVVAEDEPVDFGDIENLMVMLGGVGTAALGGFYTSRARYRRFRVAFGSIVDGIRAEMLEGLESEEEQRLEILNLGKEIMREEKELGL